MTRKPTSLLPLLLAAISAACAPLDRPPPDLVPVPEVREVRTDPVLTRCDPEPPSPPPTADYATFLKWVEAVRFAGADCRAKILCIETQQRGEACRLAE